MDIPRAISLKEAPSRWVTTRALSLKENALFYGHPLTDET
jgi:hypothetical protein